MSSKWFFCFRVSKASRISFRRLSPLSAWRTAAGGGGGAVGAGGAGGADGVAAAPGGRGPEGAATDGGAAGGAEGDGGGATGGEGSGAGGGGAGRGAFAFFSPYSTMPVQSSPKRLFCVSSTGNGMSWMTSRALVTPSTRDSTKPSVGESVIFWKRRRGSGECWSTRSMSPRA